MRTTASGVSSWRRSRPWTGGDGDPSDGEDSVPKDDADGDGEKGDEGRREGKRVSRSSSLGFMPWHKDGLQ